MARKKQPTQPGTVIRKHGPSREFAGPTSVNQFARNGFKAEDRGASK